MAEEFAFEDVAEPESFSFEQALETPERAARRKALQDEAADLRQQGLAGDIGSKIIDAASWGAYLTPFRGTAARIFNIPGNDVPSPQSLTAGFGRFIETLPPEIGGGTPEQGSLKQGIQNTASGLVEGVGQADTAALMALGPPGWTAMAVEGAIQAPETIRQMEEAAKQGDVGGVLQGTATLGLQTFGPVGIGKQIEGAVPRAYIPDIPGMAISRLQPRPIAKPRPNEPTAITKGEPNAIQPESTQLLRDVRKEPVQGAREVPAAVSGEQVNARGSEIAAAPEQPARATEGVAEKASLPVTPELLSKELGVRVAGEGPFGILLETKNAKGEPGTSFIVKPGSTLEQAKAAYEATRKRFEGDPDQPAPLKEAGTETAQPAPVTAETLLQNEPGGTTPENVSALSDSEASKFFTGNQKRGNATQHDAVLAGMKLGPEAVPMLEKMRDEAAAKAFEAIRKNDNEGSLANQGKNVWASGAIEGALKKGPNYDIVAPKAEPVAAKGSNGMPGSLPDISAPQPAPARGQSGLAKEVRARWANATAAEPLGSEAGFISLQPLKDLWEAFTPSVQRAADAVKGIAREVSKPGKMDNYRTAVLNWSAKLQRSFGEAAQAQKEIVKAVKDPVRREAITNWIQAGGDATVLRSRAAASNPKLRPGYEAALTLTPEELTIARDVKATFDDLASRGQHYGILNSFKDNYVPQIWKLVKGFMGGGSRTLKDKFKFAKARTFESFFEGEQAGYNPKTKDISKLLPVYLHEMNSVIAARQLVEQMSKGVASDGRPLIAPRGMGKVVSDPSGTATLITPKSVKGDTLDYQVLPNQPAFNDWTWAAKDEAGNNIFLKSDLALHPEAAAKLKNVLGKSAIREWYNTKTTATAEVPKLLAKGLDFANNETKRTMLGFIAPFHQVQEGTHALGHRVNPFFNIPEIDLVRNASQMDSTRHGLMLLPDRASQAQFMEGFRPSGLVSAIPGIGKLADWYSDFLFHRYIPGLKYKTYEAILERNSVLYRDDIKAGKVSLPDIKHLSAEQANAAFGHLNYADLARNPTVQHIAQLGLLAPDFLEARGRFAGQSIKGVTGAKVGREQLLALATLAIGQAALAYTAAKLTGGEWDKKHPFEMTHGNRRYTIRSVPEDLQSLFQNTRIFVHGRLSPIIGKGTLQYGTGRDWKGQRVSAADTTKELLQQPVPLSARGFLGIGNSNLSAWEQLAGSVGLKISRNNPRAERASQLNQRVEMMTPKLRRIPLAQRRLAAIKELSDLPLSEREKALSKLARQGVFTYR